VSEALRGALPALAPRTKRMLEELKS